MMRDGRKPFAQGSKFAVIGMAVAKHPDLFPSTMTEPLFSKRVKELTTYTVHHSTARKIATAMGITLVKCARTTRTDANSLRGTVHALQQRLDVTVQALADLYTLVGLNVPASVANELTEKE